MLIFQEDLLELLGLIQATCTQLQDARDETPHGSLPAQISAAERHVSAAEKLLSRMLRRPGSRSDSRPGSRSDSRQESGEWEDIPFRMGKIGSGSVSSGSGRCGGASAWARVPGIVPCAWCREGEACFDKVWYAQ